MNTIKPALFDFLFHLLTLLSHNVLLLFFYAGIERGRLRSRRGKERKGFHCLVMNGNGMEQRMSRSQAKVERAKRPPVYFSFAYRITSVHTYNTSFSSGILPNNPVRNEGKGIIMSMTTYEQKDSWNFGSIVSIR